MEDGRPMQRIVGVGDYAVSDQEKQKLITFSLGSCIGLTLFDPAARVGGLLHAQMPLSRMSPARGEERPGLFVDTGVTALLGTLLELGASRRNLVACIAGAASIFNDEDAFDIGRRNYMVARKLLWKNKILVAAEDVGGSFSRTMWLEMSTGRTRLKRQGTLLDLHPGSPAGAPVG